MTVPEDERLWQYQDVTCGACGAQVAVVKFSPQHTSVQWTTEAALTCAEFGAVRQSDGAIAPIPTCTSLQSSIRDAVAEARLKVQPP